jgi:iron(III) transport system permease protein
MKFLPKSLAILAILLAALIVFSPLVAALTGTGMHTSGVLRAIRKSAGLYGASAGSAFVGALAALIIGTPFALLLERSRPALRRILWALGLLVLMVPPYIVAEAWIVLFGPAGKISRGVALLLGLGPRSTDPMEIARFAVSGFVYTWPTVGVIMGGCLFPIVALAVGSAYRRTDHRVFEAARLMRGRRGVFQIAGRILLEPALGASLLVFAVTLTEFAVPELLRVPTVGEAIYEQIQHWEIGAAAALCLPLLPVVLIAGATGAFMLARARTASMAGLEGEVPKYSSHASGVLTDLTSTGITLFAITSSIILPAISLIWLAVKAKLPPESVLGSHKLLRASGFIASLHGAWDLVHDDAIRTVVLAGFASTLATIFSIIVARLASRIGWGAVLGALGAGLAVPAPIVGLGLVTLWNGESTTFIDQSFAIILLAWFARFLPLSIFLVQGALARVPRELEHAAALAGRGPLRRFMAVVLPNASPGIIASWLAMYVLCATEYGTTQLIYPPGSPPLAPSIINLMRRGQDPEIAACQVLLLAVVALPLVPIAIAALWHRRTAKGSK